MPRKITSDSTSITIDVNVYPKNSLSLQQEGNYFTIKWFADQTIASRVLFSDFSDSTGNPYTSPAAFVTAFKAAAYI